MSASDQVVIIVIKLAWVIIKYAIMIPIWIVQGFLMEKRKIDEENSGEGK